jgi:hypothetical protein
MAQTGFTPIQLYSSSTPTNAPSAGNLTNDTKGSELAINIADKNLFFKDSTNAVNTVPIRQSGTTSDGWLSSTDWNTFNNKQPAGTYVNSVTGTAPVVSSGGTNPAISMAAATTSVNGYLTSTDWNTFNNKQAALVSGTNIKTVNGTTLLGSGDLGTIGIAYGGTGLTSFTAGQIHYGSFNTSANFTYASNNLSIGTGDLIFDNSYGIKGKLVAGSAVYMMTRDSSNKVVIDADGYGALIGFGGRYDFAGNGNFTCGIGNIIIGTSGKGIDFSATPGTGTSELLADYEEGTWTPVDGSGASLSFTDTSGNCFYTKVGNVVTACFIVTYPSTASGSFARIGGLPFTSKTTTSNPQGGFFTEQSFSAGATISISSNATSFIILTSGVVAIATNANLSTKTLKGVVVYQV